MEQGCRGKRVPKVKFGIHSTLQNLQICTSVQRSPSLTDGFLVWRKQVAKQVPGEGPRALWL